MATLRVNRVKTIMKTSDGTDFVGKDAAWLVARATVCTFVLLKLIS